MFQVSYRVYYEDTDAGGVVYYANYLKFAERARTDWLRSIGIEQAALKLTHGMMFVVRDVRMHLKKPARLDDLVTLTLHVKQTGRARVTFYQDIRCGDVLLAQLEVCVVCVNEEFKPIPLPEWIMTA